MEIRKWIDRELTDAENSSIAHFNYYFNNEHNYALLEKEVVLLLPGNRQIDRNLVTENKNEALRRHPSYNSYVMEDGFGLIVVANLLLGITNHKLTNDELDEGIVSLSSALQVRKRCLEACKLGRVLAIVKAVT